MSLLSRLDGTVDASWAGRISNLRTRADLTLKSLQGRDTKPNSATMPVDGSIHASYDGGQNAIAFRDTSLRVPSATISAQGTVSTRSNLQIQASTTDLHQVAELFSTVGGEKSPSFEIAGSASLQATIRGSLQNLKSRRSLQRRICRCKAANGAARNLVSKPILRRLHCGTPSLSARSRAERL